MLVSFLARACSLLHATPPKYAPSPEPCTRAMHTSLRVCEGSGIRRAAAAGGPCRTASRLSGCNRQQQQQLCGRSGRGCRCWSGQQRCNAPAGVPGGARVGCAREPPSGSAAGGAGGGGRRAVCGRGPTDARIPRTPTEHELAGRHGSSRAGVCAGEGAAAAAGGAGAGAGGECGGCGEPKPLRATHGACAGMPRSGDLKKWCAEAEAFMFG